MRVLRIRRCRSTHPGFVFFPGALVSSFDLYPSPSVVLHLIKNSSTSHFHSVSARVPNWDALSDDGLAFRKTKREPASPRCGIPEACDITNTNPLNWGNNSETKACETTPLFPQMSVQKPLNAIASLTRVH